MVFIKNAKPIELMSPAYAGRVQGHANRGISATPIAGIVASGVALNTSIFRFAVMIEPHFLVGQVCNLPDSYWIWADYKSAQHFWPHGAARRSKRMPRTIVPH